MQPQLTLTNFQNWQFKYTIANNGKVIPQELKSPEGREMLDQVGYVWNLSVKKSKTSSLKTLGRNLAMVRQSRDIKAFEVCKRKEGIFVVFGKTNDREDSLVMGGLLFLGGCALMASGVGIVAAPFIGGGASTFLDAYKKDVVVFNKHENAKQGAIGALTSIVTGCFSAVLPVGNAVGSSVAAKAIASSATSTVGYITSTKLNGESPTLKGAMTAVVAGGVAPVVSNKVGSAFTLPAADQVDDLATAMLIKSAAEGAASAGASQVARNICDGKPLTEDLGISVASGAVTSVAQALPEVLQVLDKPIESSAAASSPSEKKPAAVSTPAGSNTEQLRQEAARQWGNEIARMISKGYRVLINGKWEKPPKRDGAYHQNNFLDMIANGQQLVFKKDGWTVTCGFTEINTPANLLPFIQKGWKFVLNGKTEKPPKKDADFHSQNIMERLQNGEIITIKKDGAIRVLTAKPLPKAAPPATPVVQASQIPPTTSSGQKAPDTSPAYSAAEANVPNAPLGRDVGPVQPTDASDPLGNGIFTSSIIDSDDDIGSGNAESETELPEDDVELIALSSEHEDEFEGEFPESLSEEAAHSPESWEESLQELAYDEQINFEEQAAEDLNTEDEIRSSASSSEAENQVDPFLLLEALDQDVLQQEQVRRQKEANRLQVLQNLQIQLVEIQNAIQALNRQLTALEANSRHYRGEIFRQQKRKLEAQITAQWDLYFAAEKQVQLLKK